MTSKAKFPLAVVAAGLVAWVAGCDRHVDLRDDGFPPSASQGRAGVSGHAAGGSRAGASGAAGVGGGSAGASGVAGGSGAPDAGDATGAAGTGGPTAGAGAPAAAGAEVAGTAGAAGSAGSPPAEPTPTPTPTPPIQAPASPPLASGGATTCGGCAKWGEPVPHGELPSILPEASGLAASARHPGVLYTHNDSGDSARFFMMDETAKVIAELRLPGATAVDWEDIALGPCPTGSCIYLADTGDGSASRPEYTIYRVAEPATLPAAGSVTSVAFESFRFLYPDDNGRHNSEALLVHPKSGRLFVIIKMGGRPSIYEMRQPLVPGALQTLVHVAVLRLPAADSIVTGADFAPCGDRMLVRTTESLYELSAPGGEVEALVAAAPVKVPVAAQEPQGEAVTYAPDGRRYFTTSETGGPQPLNIVTCLDPSP